MHASKSPAGAVAFLCRSAAVLVAISSRSLASTASPHALVPSELELGAAMGLWTVLPFAATLLAIAVLPLVARHWWEHNRNKGIVAAVLSAPVAAYLLLAHGHAGAHVLHEKLHEYAAFLALLGALYVITGGIYLRGSFAGTPLVNTGFLAAGGLLASVIGTTGASVLLIRPLLRANASRRDKVHVVVFFIFIVANCGGLLTPLGDPPLLLGYLKGVPFEWTFSLWKVWLLVNALLLVLFNVWDQFALNREERVRPGSQLEQVMQHEPFRVEGLPNVAFVLAVVFVIYAAGRGIGTGGVPWPSGWAALLLVLLALASYATTSRDLRARNRFTFGPIVEVAVLFAGIFVTMAPALLILNAWGQGQREVLGASFAVSEPWQYFWCTGALSSVLDNAPTYLTFTATAAGALGVPAEGRFIGEFLAKGPQAAAVLAAISCGAVFMGANTYIGNGPNFMVKAMAEESGVKMPSFVGYMAYSAAVLLPVFVFATAVFFR